MAGRARYLKENLEGVSLLCKVMEDMKNEAAQKAKEETTLNFIRTLMKTLNVSPQEAMEKLCIPAKERPVYAAQL